MIKKIILGFFLLLFSIGGYFYFFPIYPDYGISEEYFETRFQKEGFESDKNGFYEWKNLTESLYDKQGKKDLFGYPIKGVIGEFDTYYKCYFLNSCIGELRDISENEKVQKLQELLGNTEKMNEFGKIATDFLDSFTEITEKYDFISTLNYTEDETGQFSVGSETIQYTAFISLSRGMLFYIHYSGGQDANQNMTKLYKNLSWLSEKLDDQVLGYLVIITIANIQFDYLKNNSDTFSPIVKNILFTTVKENLISNDMITNGNKVEYSYGKHIFENLYGNILDETNRKTNKNIKTIFFWNLEDTLNLLKKINYEQLNGRCDFEIQRNGRNFIGRTLLQGRPCTNSQYQKQEDILQKREEIIQLLSN